MDSWWQSFALTFISLFIVIDALGLDTAREDPIGYTTKSSEKPKVVVTGSNLSWEQ